MAVAAYSKFNTYKNLLLSLPQMDENSLTSELFDTSSHLVHTTSVITYPVFKEGKNYSGSSPDILKTELLKKYILQNFATEFKNLDHPFIVPLGVNVSKVLDFLAENRYIEPNSILRGFPHPSGGNGHRHKQFANNKEAMEQKIETYFGVYKSL